MLQISAHGAHRGKAAAPKPSGVFVSAETVLRLAEARAMPRAVPAPANGARPAGLRLMGVGALGIGMRDGDVLTEVLGTPVGAVSQVIALVIQARGRHERRISGRFFRGNLAMSVVVEQPYVAAVAPAKPAQSPAP
jgi:hypothetical protein